MPNDGLAAMYGIVYSFLSVVQAPNHITSTVGLQMALRDPPIWKCGWMAGCLSASLQKTSPRFVAAFMTSPTSVLGNCTLSLALSPPFVTGRRLGQELCRLFGHRNAQRRSMSRLQEPSCSGTCVIWVCFLENRFRVVYRATKGNTILGDPVISYF